MATNASQMPRREREWPAAASANQERMFQASLSQGGHPQIHCLWAVSGLLDVARLRLAWVSVLRRHCVLRAPLVPGGDGLCALAPREADDQAEIQITLDPAVRQADWLNGWLEAQVADYRAGSLASPGRQGPRLSVATDGQGRHYLMIAIDHLFSDGRSMAVVARDLSRAYGGATLPAAAKPDYYDWAEWDRRRRQSAEYLSSLDLWRAASPRPDDLRSPLLSPKAATAAAPAFVQLHRDVCGSAELRERARSIGATPFAVALDAFVSAAYQVGGAEIPAVITSLHNRTQVGMLSLVGYFAHNALVPLPSLRGKDPAARIRAVGDAVIWSAGHSIVSHRELRRDLWPHIPEERRYDSSSEIVFAYNPYPMRDLALPGAVAVTRNDLLENSMRPFNFYANGLDFWLEDNRGRVRATALYRPDVINRSSVLALAGELTACLGGPARP